MKKLLVNSLALMSLPLFANAPVMAQPASTYDHEVKNGLTFELNLGIGSMIVSSDTDSKSETSLAGLSLGIGGFVNKQLAVTARIAGGTYTDDAGRLTQAFFGPAVQYWATPNVWLGGGIGLGVLAIDVNGAGSDSNTDLGFDVRAGYTFNPGTKHSFNISAEFTRSQADNGAVSVVGVLAGWQIL